jgi:hypothetical protein
MDKSLPILYLLLITLHWVLLQRYETIERQFNQDRWQSSIKYNGSQHCWMGERERLDFIIFFEIVCICVCLRALYIKNLIPPLILLSPVCLLGRRLLFVCLSSQSHSSDAVLLYANVSRA